MNAINLTVGNEVVRAKGDYVVGRVGLVAAIDNIKNRAQIVWKGDTHPTWVIIDNIELTSIPYIIIRSGRYPKYKRLYQ